MLSPALETLCASLSCVSYRGDQHTHILIEEADRAAKLKKVTLRAPNGDWFAFTPDKGRGKQAQMSPLLAIGKDQEHHRACDSVVLVHKETGLWVIYFDLKSENPHGYAGQFKSTRQFVRYALGLLEEFHNQKFLAVEEHYVILYGGKQPLLNKQTTVQKKTKTSKSRPDAAYKREVTNSANLWLKEFL